MEDSYFDIEKDEETCFKRLHRWANYDAVLFFGCVGFLLFILIMIVFLIVWAIYNK
jgi:hypothetical protein